jgi:hypothetical protein
VYIEGRSNTNGQYYNSKSIAIQVKIVEYVIAMQPTNKIYYIGDNINDMTVMLLDFTFTSKSLKTVCEVISIDRRFQNGTVKQLPTGTVMKIERDPLRLDILDQDLDKLGLYSVSISAYYELYHAQPKNWNLVQVEIAHICYLNVIKATQ